MTDEEKDAYAQRLATPEYLDLTCDWAFKYLFQNHPELLVRLLNDILQEDIMSVEFRNTELTEISPQDKRILFDLLCRTPAGRFWSRCRGRRVSTSATVCSFMVQGW